MDDDDDGEEDITLPDDLPEPQRSQFSALKTQCEAKFAAAVSLVAADYGLGNPLELPADKLDDLRDEVSELVDNWDDAEVENVSGMEVRSPLQRLLKDCYDLREQMMDIVDEVFPPDEEDD